jgi:hypothetical protein
LLQWALEPTGVNPAQFLMPPQPPKEESPKISIAIKGDDLIPFAPQYPNVVQLLTIDGKAPTFTPVAPQSLEPQVPHGGPMPGVELINKRINDLSGKLPGPSAETNTGGV